MSPRGARRDERPLLTAAESEVMQQLWSSAEGLTVRQVVANLPRKVAYTTALTTLQILERKGYVQHHPHPEGGRAHVYVAAQPARLTRRVHARDLVDRLFGGEPRALLVGLLQEEQLSADELQELRDLVDAQLKASDAAERVERRKKR